MGRAALVGSGLLLGLLLLVAILLGTSAGLSLLRPWIESGASSALTGQLALGRLSGSAFSTLIADAVRLTDDEGQPAITLGRVELSWTPSALIGGEIEVEYIRLVDPRVRAVSTATGGLNLARLVPPSEAEDEPPSEEPLALPGFKLGRLEISGGALDMVVDGQAVATVRQLEVALEARGGGSELEAWLSRLSARVQDDLPLQLEARTTLDDDRLEVRDLRLTLGEGQVEVSRFVTRLPPGPLEGRARIELPEGLLAQLGLGDLPFGAELEVRARRDAEIPRWTASLEGRLARAPLSLTATVTEGGRTKLDLEVRRLNLSRFQGKLPPSRLRVRAHAEGTLDPEDPDLSTQVDLRGWIDPDPGLPRFDVPRFTLAGRWRGDRAEASAEGTIDEARLALSAALTSLGKGLPRIQRSRVEVEIPHLARLLGSAADGTATLTATVTGPLSDLEATGRLSVSDIRAGNVQLRSADVDWQLQGLPTLPVGRASMRAWGLQLPDRRLDEVGLRLTAASEDGVLDIALPELRLRSASSVWSGTGGRLQGPSGGPLSLSGLRLAGPGGQLTAEGRAADPKLTRGDLELRLEARLDAGAFPRSLAPELAEIEGRLDLDLSAERTDGGTSARLSADLEGFRLAPERDALGGQLRLALKPGKAEARLDVEGLGESAALEARLPAPEDATQAQAWRRILRRGPLQSARLDVRAVDLARLQRILGQEPQAEGFVSLRANVQDRGARARLELDAKDIRPGPPLEATRGQAHMEVDFDHGALVLEGRLAGSPFGEGTMSATVAGPPRLFALEAWRRLGPKSVQGARIDFERLRLDALHELRIYDGMRGLVDLHVKAAPSGRPLTASVLAENVHVPPVEGRWDGALRADLADTGSVAIDLQFDGEEALTAHAYVPVQLETLISGPQDELQSTPVDVQAQLRFPLPALAVAAGLADEVLQGRLLAKFSAKGVPGQLQARLDAEAESLQIGERRLPSATLNAQLDGTRVGLRSQLAADSGGLRLAANATVSSPACSSRFEARLEGDGLPLDFLSRLGLPAGIDGALHGDLEVSARDGEIRPQGWLEARELRVVFAQAALVPIHQGSLRAELEARQAKLRLTAQALGGSLEMSADAHLDEQNEGQLASWIRLERFPIRAGQLARINMDIGAEGRFSPSEGTRLDVMIEKGEIQLADESTRKLHAVSDPSEVEYVSRLDEEPPEALAPADTSTTPSGPPLIVVIDTRKPIDVYSESKLVDARVDLDLQSRSNVTKEAGTRGRIWVPNGEVDLLGRRYRIDRAEVILDGRTPPNPRLDIRLSHEFISDGLEFFVGVGGTAQTPELRLSSSPARYSRNELLQILQGTEPSDLGKTQDQEEAALGAARSAAAGFLANQLKALTKELPEFLRLDTLEANVDENDNPSFTVGKWLNRQIFLAYRYEASSDATENQSEAVVRYRFLPGWLLELVTGDRNAWSLDVLWVRRFND